MPPTTPSRALSGPRRRSLFAGALAAGPGALLLSACSGDGAAGEGGKPDAADRRLRERAARESRDLLLRYDATAATHPELAELLAPLRAETALHATAFDAGDRSASPSASPRSGGPGPEGPGVPPAAPSPARSPDASPDPDAPRAPEVPGKPAEALKALAGAERRTADARTAALSRAEPELARLLASVAASGAAHAYLLNEAA
ncbi:MULTISPECIES: hypothetical protein [Streptomyces]|uniref:Lipoprotein n=2 Tax=Streptomyces TaxID=1883 RepID=A0A3R7EXQ9_9ACTN|nr:MULTISPECIES: hypothetical protein [Streptomyces]KNE82815.1 hypothetical protein ADZ36_09290 [Streptomyces fradiae]OFA34874.1 hypothetical protein BEN35_30560 [Streptomyces fradiae]PQM24546.1 hypothetical protein Sfr7A_07350 [Streptomyces xinghaiensis]RKM98215.1 hypothetical protein SFRA_006880 [Streptomyces xinghaiensis]RNC75589.1 hypothetical protein DC095_004560 [Streptomyces xinghaiensis]